MGGQLAVCHTPVSGNPSSSPHPCSAPSGDRELSPFYSICSSKHCFEAWSGLCWGPADSQEKPEQLQAEPKSRPPTEKTELLLGPHLDNDEAGRWGSLGVLKFLTPHLRPNPRFPRCQATDLHKAVLTWIPKG